MSHFDERLHLACGADPLYEANTGIDLAVLGLLTGVVMKSKFARMGGAAKASTKTAGAASDATRRADPKQSGMATVQTAEKQPKPQLLPSPGFGEWLAQHNGSLIFSTYQSSRVFFLSPGAGGETVGLERIVGSAMGLAVTPSALWIANKEQAWRFSNVGPCTVEDEPRQAVYMPRKGYFLGACDTHDIAAGAVFQGHQYELVFINTLYSCIAAIDPHHCFRPLWKPDFITALSPEDRCHLNGLGLHDGEVAYVTLCGRFDTPIGWKAVKNGGGLVMDVRSGEVLCEGLSMPHSPRWHNGRLWLLNSGNGDFGYVENGRFIPVALCAGFARGLCFVDNYAVIGLSRLRDNTFASGMAVKERLERARILQRCGLIIIDLNTGQTVHWLTIDGSISELYDVAFLPGVTRPYTPGFSEPDLHKAIYHAVPGIFPFAAPRSKPAEAERDEHAPEASSNQDVQP